MPYGGWKPYVSVAQRRAQAARKMAALRKNGVNIQPVEIQGRKIAVSFWGQGWCDHLESFSDYANRLPRGRTYVRNGSVCHLAITKGKVKAKVAGSELYDVGVQIKTLPKPRWKKIKTQCSGQIGSLLELLNGNLSDNIMTVVTDRKMGLFPEPAEIDFNCNCPDYAYMCKHVAAVLYGIGARLDSDPSLLFQLRDVDHNELIVSQVTVPAGTGKGKSKRLAGHNLGDVFGIELDAAPIEKTTKRQTKKKPATKTAKSGKKKKTRKKKTTKKTKKKTNAASKKADEKISRVDHASSGDAKSKATKPKASKKAGKKKLVKKKATKKKATAKTASAVKRKSKVKKRSK